MPDWPLSYGMLMPPMVGGILYEHGHRMVATFVGMLTTVLAVWIWRRESRKWIRLLGLVALGMVITQGVLGGITVIYLLPTPVSVSHATLAQTFFCVTVLLAFATSREWNEAVPRPDAESRRLRTAALVATFSIYLQLILGAVVRHTGSALAIPDFPLAFGRLIPPPPLTNASVVIHFVHRLGALLVSGSLAWLFVHVWRHVQDRRFRLPMIALGCLVIAQILLGGTVVWTSRAVLPATAHVATGALLLATTWLLTLRIYLHLEPADAV